MLVIALLELAFFFLSIYPFLSFSLSQSVLSFVQKCLCLISAIRSKLYSIYYLFFPCTHDTCRRKKGINRYFSALEHCLFQIKPKKKLYRFNINCVFLFCTLAWKQNDHNKNNVYCTQMNAAKSRKILEQ